MAFEQQLDKTQQPPAHTDGGNSLYDQIMSGPPTAAATPDAGVKTATQDVPAPGAPPATQDRSAAPATDQVVAVPPAPSGDTPATTAVVDTTGGATNTTKDVPAVAPTGDTPAAPGQPAVAPTGDTPVAPGQPAVAPTGDTPVAPGQPAVAPTGDTPAAPGQPAVAPTGDAPAAPGQPAVAPTGDTPAAPGQPAVGDNTTGTVPAAGPTGDVPVAPGQPAVAPPVEGVEDKGNCNFKPDYEYKTEQGKAWHAESELQRQKPIVLNENGRYVVTHGDCLETIAERNLKDSGLPSDRKAIRAEVADIVAANHNRYPSLDCNNEFVKDGWKLTLPQHRPGDAPRQADAPQQPAIDGQAPSRADGPADRPQQTADLPPQRDSRHNHKGVEGSGNIVIEQAGNVTIYEGGDGRSDAPRAVPSTRPYYSQNQDRPAYSPDRTYSGNDTPVYRGDNRQVYSGDGDYQDPRYNRRPPVVIDGRFQTNNDGWSNQSSWNQSNWGQQNPWANSYDSRYQQPDYGWQPYQPDYGWQSQVPRIALDFGHSFRSMGRSIPHFNGRSMPYYGGRGYRGGSGLSIQFGI